MNKEDLIRTAQQLPSFTESSYTEYTNKLEVMVIEMNSAMLSRPDINELVGEKNIEMMKDNHNNHAHFIASILKNFNADVLVETILWVFRAYRTRGFHTNYWAAQLNTWKAVITQNLSNEATKNVLPLYNWMQINIPVFTVLSDEKIEELNNKHLSH